MPYVVSSACTWSRAQSCLVVCPVDCFYADAQQLHISPDECIDCGACEPECPSLAIRFEESADHPDVLAAHDRIASGAATPARTADRRETLTPDAHRARRDAFLADLARAAEAGGRPELVPAVETWLPHAPLKSGEPRPKSPSPGDLDVLLALLRDCFPGRWASRVDDVRSLIAVPPYESLSSADDEDGSD